MISVLASATTLISIHFSAWELARTLRDAGVSIGSGFHTPLERECLDLLLRGTQPITIVPARAYETGQWLYGGETWKAIKQGIARGNVTIQVPPGVKGTRVTKESAEIRNRYLLELGHPLVILAAPPGSKTAALAQAALSRGRTVFALPHKSHQPLFDAGAREATIDAILTTVGKPYVPDAYI